MHNYTLEFVNDIEYQRSIAEVSCNYLTLCNVLELYLGAGLGPRRDNKTVNALFRLAQEYKVPVLIHIDSSRYKYFESICKKHPEGVRPVTASRSAAAVERW